jgi:hypothetical protein
MVHTRRSNIHWFLAIGSLTTVGVACGDSGTGGAGGAGASSSSAASTTSLTSVATSTHAATTTTTQSSSESSSQSSAEASSSTGVDPCVDGMKNGSETDVDCGGPVCSKCADGDGCIVPSDCVVGVCTNNQCDGIPTAAQAPDSLAPTVSNYAPKCVVSASDGTPTTDCWVITWNGYRYWALSDANNGVAFDIVAVKKSGVVTNTEVHPGTRYVWNTSVDTVAQTVTFYGQGTGTVTMTWAALAALK